MLATPANMKTLEREANQPICVPGLYAYSPGTGEEYSASSGDYWDADPNEPLRDVEGEPMILARRTIVWDQVTA